MGQVKRQLAIWGAIAATTAVLPGLALAEVASPDHGGRGRNHQHGDSTLSVAGRALSRADKDAWGMEIKGRSGEKPTDAGGMVRFAHRGEKGSEGLIGEIDCLSKDGAGIVSVTGTIKRSGTRDARKERSPKPGAQTAAAGNDDDVSAFLDELAPLSADETADPSADNPAPPGAPAAPGMPSAPGQDPDKKDPDKKDPGNKDPGNKDPDKKGPGRDRGKRGGELAGKVFAFTIDVPGDPQHFSKPTIGDKGAVAACSGGGSALAVTRGGFRATQSEGHGDRGGRGDHGDGDGRGRFGRR